MTAKTFDAVLDECVTMMHSGASVDECVSRFPDHADELRLQLTTAGAVLAARNGMQPEASAQAQGRARLLSAVAEQSDAASTPSGFGLLSALWGRTALLPRAIPVVLAMLLLGGAAWGVSAAATGNPNPGAWFSISSSSEERIEFEGVVTAITEDSLTVETGRGGRTALINGDTELEDADGQTIALTDLSLGDRVKVVAIRNGDNALLAIEVERATAGVSEREGQEAGADDEADAADDDRSGPGSSNSGPGNAGSEGDDDEDGADDDRSGPGNGDDADDNGHDAEDDGDDDSGPNSPNSGPGNADDDDDGDGDSSGSSSTGSERELGGVITALASGRITIVVDGRSWTVIVHGETEIRGEGGARLLSDLSLGNEIKVHGTEGPDGTIRADRIELEDDGDGEHEDGHDGEEEERDDDD